MTKSRNALARIGVLVALMVSISGCTGWIERQADRASVAIDCAVLVAAEVPKTGQTAHCDRHPAARS